MFLYYWRLEISIFLLLSPISYFIIIMKNYSHQITHANLHNIFHSIDKISQILFHVAFFSYYKNTLISQLTTFFTKNRMLNTRRGLLCKYLDATESARKSLPHHYAIASCLQPATHSLCDRIIYTQAGGDHENRRPAKQASLNTTKTTERTKKNGVTRHNSTRVNASNP